MTKFRFGVLGAVHEHLWPTWGKGLLRELTEHPEVEIVAAAESKPELRTRLQREFEIPALHEDYTDMLESHDLDAVVMGLPNNGKVDPCLAAARQGVHILMDKPMTATLPQAERIVEAAESANIHLMVNSLSAWRPPVRKALEMAQNGAVGDIYWVKWRSGNPGSEKHGPGASDFFLEWVWDMEKNGGGVLINYVYYGALYITSLLGRPLAVNAMGGHFQKDEIPQEMEDNAVVNLQYESAIGTAEASWTQEGSNAAMEIDPTNGGLMIYGSEGIIRGASKRRYVDFANREYPNGTRIYTPAPEGSTTGPDQFVECLKGNAEVENLTSMRANLLVQEVIDRSYEALREGRTVKMQ